MTRKAIVIKFVNKGYVIKNCTSGNVVIEKGQTKGTFASLNAAHKYYFG